jgi:hypothetical protein
MGTFSEIGRDKVINRCVRHGWLLKDPFANFKITLREVERIALTETELQTLAVQQFPTDRLRVVRDIFLFSCYTGLAYADVKKLKRSEIVIGVDGEQWLVSRRLKTDLCPHSLITCGPYNYKQIQRPPALPGKRPGAADTQQPEDECLPERNS